MRCIIACLAVWAAMRPKLRGVTSTSISSPSLRVRLELLRLRKRDFVRFIAHPIDDFQLRHRLDFAGLRVDFDAQVIGGANGLFRRGKQSVRDGLDEDLALDALLPLEIIES